ncbi:hypothetical protein V497_01747 [Pseudogymnoascus sp. VKM F-4516 (FW-969)]|nr:hypothetical protein V497_01747 [Pseudogymnoascus sp. VKM F-4516 (FW-969)]
MDEVESTTMKKSQIRPPSRIPSPGKGLSEITESQNNSRLRPPGQVPQSLKSSTFSAGVRMVNDDEPKRKTLVERAGEPARPNTSFAPGRSVVKGTSLTSARSTSIASSTSSRPQSSYSRNTSASSFASSVGPGVRPPSSYGGRPQTSMSRARSNTASSKRPATAMDDHLDPGGGPASGKRQVWDVHGRIEDMEAMYFELKDTMADTNVERKNLEETVRHYKIKLLSLESKNSALEAKKTALESQNTTSDARIASQQAELDAARQRAHTMMTEADDNRRSHRIELEDAIHNHRRELDQVRRDMTEEIDRLKKTHQRNTDDEFERLDKAHREEIRELERKNALHLEEEERRRVQDLHEVKMQITLEQQNLDLAVGNKDREIQTLREQIEQMKGELEQEQTSKATIQRSLNDSSSSVVNLEGTVRSLRDRIQFLESGSQAQSDRFALMEQQLQDALEQAKESKSKLTKEETLRRILFNQVQELKGNIRVMCRVRPTSPSEEVAKIAYPDVEKESKELELMGPEEKSSLGTITRKTNAFTFDRTFGPSTTNEEVFGEISQLVQSALDGYNVCIFCYGQTGAGKTHTMSSADGMIPRATHMIYEKATDLQDKGWTYSMEGSFVEVYNEEIHDLLGNPREFDKVKHEIRHDEKKKQTSVTNLKSVELDSPDAVESILKRADANRSVAATKSNERSSRSHSVFILKLLGRNSTTGETSEGTLNLVDLAGSERLKQSGAEGDRMKETQNINKSLSCLGDVIGALGQGKEGGHIPYRNSKLTYLLQYSLGGNSKTLMFVMISPLEAHVKETLTSLKFATKVHNTHIGTAKKTTRDRNWSLKSANLVRDVDSGDDGSFKTWIMETVDSKTLLTREELTLYNALEELGEASSLGSTADLEQVRAFDELEIQNATAQLKSSTAAIEKQNEILKIQHAAASTLAATEAQQRQRRALANSAQHRLWKEALERVNAQVEEAASGLAEHVSSNKAQCAATDAALVQQSSSLLRSDDKIISSLQKLSRTLQYGMAPENDTFERIRKLCTSLIKYTVEGVRLRLDRAYIEALGANQVEKNSALHNDHEVLELQAELDSLYSEILPVAQMSAEQRYLDCAVRAIASQDKQGLEKSKTIIEYISESTTFLIDRAEVFKRNVEAYQSHIATLNAVVQLLSSEITSPPPSQPAKPPQPRSPLHSRSHKPSSPVRPRAMNRRRSSASSFDESVPPDQQILRIMGIPPLEELCRDRAPETALHETLSDRIHKLKAHESGLQASTESAVGEHVQDAFATLQMLSDTMLSETKYQDIRLLDEEVQEAITGLDRELADLEGRLGRIDFERLKERNLTKEAFVERWDH